MPRKPHVRSRTEKPRPPASSKKRVHQCTSCGALVDPIYGLGDGSWCPHCHKTDDICYDEGKIPDPILYGAWLQKQEKLEAEKTMTGSSPAPNTPSRSGGLNMRTAKYHSGTFHCPDCCVDFDLVMEQVLKCDRCGGALLKGSICDWEDDEDGDEDEE